MVSEKFMWGAAMAANQCEGAYLEDGKGLSIVDLLPDAAHGRWDMLYHPEKYLGKELEFYPSHVAIDFYHRWKEDLELLAGMGIRAFRTSISWPRIFHSVSFRYAVRSGGKIRRLEGSQGRRRLLPVLRDGFQAIQRPCAFLDYLQ